MFTKTCVRTSVMVALGLVSVGAMAKDRSVSLSDDTPRVVVSYQDLDLTSENGAVTLYQRIAGAAKQVCPAANGLSINESRQRASCISAAIERAVSDVNSPTLAKVGASRSKRLAQT